jgi:hypothetical protein
MGSFPSLRHLEAWLLWSYWFSFAETQTQNSKLKTQNSKLKTQNSKLKTQNSFFLSEDCTPWRLVTPFVDRSGNLAGFAVSTGASRVRSATCRELA